MWDHTGRSFSVATSARGDWSTPASTVIWAHDTYCLGIQLDLGPSGEGSSRLILSVTELPPRQKGVVEYNHDTEDYQEISLARARHHTS